MKIADAIEAAVRTNEPVKIEGCHVNLIIMREEAFNRLKEKQDGTCKNSDDILFNLYSINVDYTNDFPE